MKKVVFVGSFRDKAIDGSVGGQMFACKSLINSPLSESVDIIPFDITAVSVPAPPIYKRVPNVILRLLKFFFLLLFKKIDTALIFSSAGPSLLEKAVMVSICKLTKTRVVFAPRSGLIKNDVEHKGYAYKSLIYILRNASVILCQSTDWKTFFMNINPTIESKLVVQQNWIDVKKYDIERKVESGKNIKIIYLGWLEVYKGVIDLIEAIDKIKSKGIQNFKLYVYGSGSLKNKIELLIEKKGLSSVIELCGWADEKIKFEALKTADFFVLPSHTEGFPNALLEAMAAGVPSLAADVGGVPSIIKHKENGLMFKSKDIDELVECLELYLLDENKRLELGERGKKHVEENNSSSFAAANLLRVL